MRMHHRPLLFVLGLAAVLPAQESRPTSKLADARRPLVAKRKYESKPRYLLMALGQPVRRSVWIVLDGAVLYVDRDGDGRLDAAGERFTPRVKKVEDHFVAESHDYDIGGLPEAKGSPAYPGLEL